MAGNDAENERSIFQRRPWVAWTGSLLVALVALVALALVAGAAVAWIKVPNLYPEYQPPVGAPALTPEVAATRASSRDQSIVTTRASVLAALAGLGALVTIGINYRNSLTNTRTLATTQETFRISERGHLTDRYTKAIEQLGNEGSIAIRLGGIYALQQLAVDTNRDSDQAAVVEVLSAFVRLARAEMADYAGPNAEAVDPPADMLAAISVLAQLPVRHGAPMRTDFTGVDFRGIALSGARLKESKLRRVAIAGAVLAGANLNSADLTEADLSGAFLARAALVRASLVDALLLRADLADALLSGADLSNARLAGADLADAYLDGANLTHATLTSADLLRANLTQANLSGALVSRADLTGAILTGADLTDTRLSRSDLTGADLTGATLTRCDLTGATVAGTIGLSALSEWQRMSLRSLPDAAAAPMSPTKYEESETNPDGGQLD